MLSCHNLTCIRGGRTLFQGLGMSLLPGSLLILRGANGAGKTSLLKIMAGLLKPQAGEVLWQGQPISTLHTQIAYKNAITYIGDKNAIKPSLTVEENLRFWAGMDEMGEALLPAAMKYFELTRVADMLAGELSSGWQRRVALARLLLDVHPVWLLDEPTNFLDTAALSLFGGLIESRVAQGGIVIIASHTLQSAIAGHVMRVEDFYGES